MKNSNALSLVLVIGIFVVIGCSCPRLNELNNRGSSTPVSTPVAANTTSSTPSSSSKSALSLDKYNQIKNGMSYKQVVEILGVEGTEISSSEIGKYKTVSYKWEGENFQFIYGTFQNDKLLSKTQANLK